MIRGFVGAALCVLLGFAALLLWRDSGSPELQEAVRAVASSSQPEAKSLAYSVGQVERGVLGASIWVWASLLFAVASSVWLLRPVSRRVLVGAALGALVAFFLVVVATAFASKLAAVRAQSTINSVESSTQSPP